jgi:hypothetical protein
VRGGSYFNSAACCRFAARERWGGGRYVGFRLLAGPTGIACTPAEATFPTDNIKISRKVGIYDAIDTDDFDLALRVIAADPAAAESADEIPPPLQACIYDNKPQWLEWLLDHGADIERREQDYGSTPLTCAVVHRRQRIIRILVERGADTTRAMASAQRGLAGDYEDDPRLDREGYREIIELLRELGIN